MCWPTEQPRTRLSHHPITHMRSPALLLLAALGALLTTCKTACDDLTPFVEAVYASLGKDASGAVLKADKSMFSLADGIVQARATPNRTAHAHAASRDDAINFDERC